jgi:hypothetical protein
MTTNTVLTLDELKAAIATAATAGSPDFDSLIKQYNSRKAEVAKAAQEAAQKEQEALAGARQELATRIYQAVKGVVKTTDFEAVKAHGFTFKLDEPDATGTMIHYKSVALLVPVIKAAKKSTGNGGTHTSSKAEYGKTLDEIFQEFATAEDKAKLEAAESNSAKWQVKNAVKKAALAAGKLQPAK